MVLTTLLYSILFLVLSVSDLKAQEICEALMKAWDTVQNYQCTYQAKTFQEGKETQTLMRYSYQRPNKIRMDIQKPKQGAVLLYNPEVLEKVRVRPSPSLPFFILKYPLTHKRVSSDSGGTIDRSDLGSRIALLCEDIKKYSYQVEKNQLGMTLTLEMGLNAKRKYYIGHHHFIYKIEVFNGQGKIQESFEWKDLKLNESLDSELFIKF
jgi:hypothetical protein